MTTVSATITIEVTDAPVSVVNNVWTPTRDAFGAIMDSSWRSLPLMQWVEVANSNPSQQIREDLVAKGFDPGYSIYQRGKRAGGTGLTAVQGSFAFCGLGLDLPTHRAWVMNGGGHADSSSNGIWRFDIDKLKWSVEQLPSDPDRVGYEWSSEYIASGNYTIYPTLTDGNAANMRDSLPDATPTSRHYYRSCNYDPVRNLLLTHRYRQWRYSLSSRDYSYLLFERDGAVLDYNVQADKNLMSSHNMFTHLDTASRKLYGVRVLNDTYRGVVIDMDADTMSRMAPTGITNGYFDMYMTACVRGREWVFIDGNYGNSSAETNIMIFDMDTGLWSTQQIANWPLRSAMSVSELRAFEWVPDVGKFLFQWAGGEGQVGRRKFIWIDPDTWTWEFATLGPLEPWQDKVGNGCFYYPAQKCVIYVRQAANIYAMRVG